MSRISIDVTEEEHRRLKALAALQGVTLKEYMLQRVLASREESEEKALAELGAFLHARIRRAETEGASSRSVDEIFDSVCEEKGISPQNG